MYRIVKAILICVLLVAATDALSQQYYVVIGAFRIESNAKKFAGYARSKYFDATYDRNTGKALFYVYIMNSADHEEAISYARKLQQETEFKDAWVFYGLLANDRQARATSPKPVQAKPAEPEPQAKTDTLKTETTTKATEDYVPVSGDSLVFSHFNVSENPANLKPKGKLFKFVITSTDGKTIPADVHAVNRQVGRDLATFKGNTYVDVVRIGGIDKFTIVCGVFGFREVEKTLNYSDPSLTEGAVQDSTGVWIVPFVLDKLQEGDASVMYHVSFYKDAVAMLPQSKGELDQLVNLLKSNPGYTITVHGHCNGDHDRKIIALGESKNYFTVEGSTQINGSAKDLSGLRAAAVRSYLMDNGIEEQRIKTYSWGGSDMLVDEFSPSAKLNDRIEIEIMK